MSHPVRQRLSDLGITLPTPAAPAANYVPFVISGAMLFVSGQLPVENGAMIKGCMGQGATLEQGQQAARICAVNILAQAALAVAGDWDRVVRCVKLGGFVASTPDFFDHPQVMNGASDLTVAVLGDAGRHARFALGVAALPFGALVEVDAVFEIK